MHRLVDAGRPGVFVPVVGLAATALTWGRSLPPAAAVVVALVHVAVVLVTVQRAEAIAHHVGEPLGTLVLAVAVTVIEVALLVTLMATEGEKAATLARDTVFAAVMIVCHGVVGACLLLGARRTGTARFREQGAQALLGTVLLLATLSLVMPTFTESSTGPTFTGSQLAFSAVSSTVVYGVFVFVQTHRHRGMFLAPGDAEDAGARTGADAHAPGGALLGHLAQLVTGLVVVVGLAKVLAPSIETAVVRAGAPPSFVGVVIAMMVLLPEALAAFRAAARGDVQTSLNLSMGSALASIGLTIPAVAIASIWLDGPVVLGLDGTGIVLLVLTAVLGVLTFGSGRATVLQATHHLAAFGSFVFLAVVP